MLLASEDIKQKQNESNHGGGDSSVDRAPDS